MGGSAVVGGVIVREDGPVLGENVKEMNSADLNGTTQVVVGWRGENSSTTCMMLEETVY